MARYESGTPLEVGDLDDDDARELAERPGAERIDLARGRVRPRLVVDLAVTARVARLVRVEMSVRASVLNAFNRAYAFNFGNPFSGTHFGAPRTFRVDAQVAFD
jgi:outer membrane receptor protein involved in Fe transport